MALSSRLSLALLSATLSLTTHALPWAQGTSQIESGAVVDPQGNDHTKSELNFPKPDVPMDGNFQGWSGGLGTEANCGPNRVTWDLAISQLQAQATTNNTCSQGPKPPWLGVNDYYCFTHVSITAPEPENSALLAVCAVSLADTGLHPPCDAEPGSPGGSVVGAVSYLRDSLSDRLGDGGRAWIGRGYEGFYAVMARSEERCVRRAYAASVPSG